MPATLESWGTVSVLTGQCIAKGKLSELKVLNENATVDRGQWSSQGTVDKRSLGNKVFFKKRRDMCEGCEGTHL